MPNLPQARMNNLVVQEFTNEILIYDLKTNKAFCLNETSAMIWQLCNGKRTVKEISQHLSKKLNQPLTEDVIWLAFDSFKKDNLLEESEQFEISFNGLSRRQVIRKVGLASIIALPLISSILAPNAAMAASGCVNPSGLAAGTFLGGAGGTGFCSTPGIANATCTSIRGNLCCSGIATADGCFDSAPGPNFGTFSVACRCA